MFQSKRVRFFLAHLAISFIILIILMYLILYKWYPYNLFFTSGGWQGTKIVFFVDMVLGPALTLILTNPGKPNAELIRDLCFCALVQVSALSYGISLLINTKPAFLSIYDGAIYAVQNEQIENAPDKSAYRVNTGNGLPLIYSDDINRYDLSISKFKKTAQTILAYGQDFGVPPHAVPATFDSLENRKEELQTLTKQSILEANHNSSYDDQEFQNFSERGWYILKIDGSFKDGYLVFDEEGKIHESICCH